MQTLRIERTDVSRLSTVRDTGARTKTCRLDGFRLIADDKVLPPQRLIARRGTMAAVRKMLRAPKAAPAMIDIDENGEILAIRAIAPSRIPTTNDPLHGKSGIYVIEIDFTNAKITSGTMADGKPYRTIRRDGLRTVTAFGQSIPMTDEAIAVRGRHHAVVKCPAFGAQQIILIGTEAQCMERHAKIFENLELRQAA